MTEINWLTTDFLTLKLPQSILEKIIKFFWEKPDLDPNEFYRYFEIKIKESIEEEEDPCSLSEDEFL